MVIGYLNYIYIVRYTDRKHTRVVVRLPTPRSHMGGGSVRRVLSLIDSSRRTCLCYTYHTQNVLNCWGHFGRRNIGMDLVYP